MSEVQYHAFTTCISLSAGQYHCAVRHNITCVPLRLNNKKPFCICSVYGRIAKRLFVIVLLFCMLLVYLVDDAEHHVQSESHRFCGETLGHVVVGVIIMAHDGILSGESDGFYA